MTTQQERLTAVANVENQPSTWVLGSAKRTYEATKDAQDGSSPLAAFILISCAIDYLAGFYCGIESFTPRPGESSRNYKAFVTKYLSGYDPTDVYNHVRCRLAHNFAIGGDVTLTHLHPERHDPSGTRGRKVINFDDFLNDFRAAANAYFNDLSLDHGLQDNFLKRYRLGLLGSGPI